VSGASLPSWLSEGRKANLRPLVQSNKSDPHVAVDSSYARVLLPGGREVIINVRNLAPCLQESTVHIKPTATKAMTLFSKQTLMLETFVRAPLIPITHAK